jgi:MYXO-CTERM domain-containing protein
MRWAVLVAAAALAAIPSQASSLLIGAIEDLPGAGGVERNGDFNDLIFSIRGEVSVNAPGSTFTLLTPGLLSENGPIFWDNPSLGNKDIGYCLLGNPLCAIAPLGTVNYMAGTGGTQLLDQTLQAQGAVTFEILGRFSAYASMSSLGWCSPSDCVHTQHTLFAPGSAATSITVTPGGAFALYFTNGLGQFYGSRAADNAGESTGQQHFAFFSDPPANVVPEPAAFGLAALGLAGLIVRKRSR